MSNEHGPSGGAKCPPHNEEGMVCETTDSQMVAIEASDVVVSQAISPAVSLNNGREKLTTETKSDKSGDQSCSNSAEKPDCYQCVYRGSLPYSAHSTCNHPAVADLVDNPLGRLLGILSARSRTGPIAETILGVSGNQHGIDNGWFMWPINFDPVWLETCDGFKKKESA